MSNIYCQFVDDRTILVRDESGQTIDHETLDGIEEYEAFALNKCLVKIAMRHPKDDVLVLSSEADVGDIFPNEYEDDDLQQHMV